MSTDSRTSQHAQFLDAPAHRPRRVLLAEDDTDVRALLAKILRQDGFEVLEAKDGVELLDLIGLAFLHERASPAVDAVITDVMMPGCTGLDVLAGLRQADWGTPFIIITAFASAATKETARKLGAVVFSKPIDIGQLRAAVSRATWRAPTPVG